MHALKDMTSFEKGVIGNPEASVPYERGHVYLSSGKFGDEQCLDKV
jgi:hypothetical protein